MFKTHIHFPPLAVSAGADRVTAVDWSRPTTYLVDPLTDPRWPDFVQLHAVSSIFHSRGWLESLHRTYGYRPLVLTSSSASASLADGIVFCRVSSRLTGLRYVSVPFSDHCQPLAASGEITGLMAGLLSQADGEGCAYVEIRPAREAAGVPQGFAPGPRFYGHHLDLRLGEAGVYCRFHRDCVQRKIRRAEKEGLEIRRITDERGLGEFYRLVIQTRRRQGLPPQPIDWFRNVLKYVGSGAAIRLAYRGRQPVAGILTLQFKKTLYYKYGASDAAYHYLGAMPYLFWHVIREGIAEGFEQLDFGRTDCNNPGLLAFKEHLGGTRCDLVYWRAPAAASRLAAGDGWSRRVAGGFCRHMPDGCLAALGKLLYRHMG